jgi:hypothetical protein
MFPANDQEEQQNGITSREPTRDTSSSAAKAQLKWGDNPPARVRSGNVVRIATNERQRFTTLGKNNVVFF